MRSAPVTASWMPVTGTVVHIFTHFRLELSVYRAIVPVDTSLNLWARQEHCRWVQRRDLHGQALPSVMKKIIAHGLADN
jgi:A/G-specific adenine glycosylase